jgi:anthranilate synthase component 1
MTKQEFETLISQGYNRIPFVRELLADLDTPLSVYLKLADLPFTYLFESVHGGEKWGRYSIIGLASTNRIEVHGRTVREIVGDKITTHNDVKDPLTFIETLQQQYKVPSLENMPKFTGGFVGYFGYDTIRYIETKLAVCPNKDELETPDILLMQSEDVVVFDNLHGKLFLVVHVDPATKNAYEQGLAKLDKIEKQLREPLRIDSHIAEQVNLDETDFVSGFTQDGFEKAVNTAKQYITDGDIMQVVLSQRLSAPFNATSLDLYRALRSLNPSPYMYYLNLGAFQIVGSSPEILVRMEDGVVTVRPIAGTRPRGQTEAEDKALEEDLLADPKELAEHLMLIDLGRNDAGRIAKTGTVKVTEQMTIERYSHVMHIVSNVIGEVKDGMTAMDVLRATFPAGTVSGAPKIRAMEIIDELEPVKRGVYSGAVGYIGWQGNIDTAIAIRTAVVKDGMLIMQSGAGIVYDSVPANEWEETMNKGRAVFRAAALASRGLHSTRHE